MTLDMWFKEDLRNILVGVELASTQHLPHDDEKEERAYSAGFKAALTAVAASLGLLSGEDLRFGRSMIVPEKRTQPGPKTLPS